MELKEARDKFIQAWGTFGTNWGINRAMAQIHALLLISSEPLSAEEIMKELNISRGNVNMNVRELISWGIVSKVLKMGERKEFFEADKDIHKVAMKILKERRKRELGPVIELFSELQTVKGKDKETKEFKKTIDDIATFGNTADKMLDKMVRADEHWFTGNLIKFLTK